MGNAILSFSFARVTEIRHHVYLKQSEIICIHKNTNSYDFGRIGKKTLTIKNVIQEAWLV